MNQRVSRLSLGPKHHFFGYYGISSWNRSQKYHLALETDFHRRRPEVGDSAQVGLIDARTREFTPFGETSAFNLQQGAMMHWIDAGFGEEFTFNDWEGNDLQGRRLVSRAINPLDGAVRTVQGAIAGVAPSGDTAIGLDFARMAHCRPVVGYANETDPDSLEPYPEDDGLFLLDLRSGESRLVLSIAEVIAASPAETPRGGLAWFNHVTFNTDGTRLLFFCRIKKENERGFYTSVWSVNPDGTELERQIGFDFKSSHYSWRDPKRVMISTEAAGGMGFVELTDRQPGFRRVGGDVLPEDGHNSFSPDRRWVVCDTYPRGPERLQELFLYDVESGTRFDLGSFHSDAVFSGDIRCDLHPRWSPDGKTISIDSVHEGTRQIYLIDVADIVVSRG